MAFTKTWNEATPAGTLPAGQIDTAIQDAKISIRERLEQVIPNFGNDAVDPKRVKSMSMGLKADRPNVNWGGLVYFATDENLVYYTQDGGAWALWPGDVASRTSQGLLADRPNPPESGYYWATDTNQLFINESDVWVDVVATQAGAATFASGDTADKPNPPATTFFIDTTLDQLYMRDGTSWVTVAGPGAPPGASLGTGTFAAMPGPPTVDLYFAHDVKRMYVKVGGAYVETEADVPIVYATATIKRGHYNGALPANSRVTDFGDVPKVLSAMMVLTTDVNSFVYIDLDEFNVALGTPGYYNVTQLVGLHIELFQDGAGPVYPGGGRLGMWNIVTATNIITMQAYEKDTDNAANATQLKLLMTAYFRA